MILQKWTKMWWSRIVFNHFKAIIWTGGAILPPFFKFIFIFPFEVDLLNSVAGAELF